MVSRPTPGRWVAVDAGTETVLDWFDTKREARRWALEDRDPDGTPTGDRRSWPSHGQRRAFYAYSVYNPGTDKHTETVIARTDLARVHCAHWFDEAGATATASQLAGCGSNG